MKNLTWQNPEQLFVAQELINKVKSKCCGIKVDKDLTQVLSVSKDFDYWQNSKCETFPYSNSEDTKYSMHPNIDESMMIKLQEKGILVFYDNIIDPHHTPLNFDL